MEYQQQEGGKEKAGDEGDEYNGDDKEEIPSKETKIPIRQICWFEVRRTI